MLINGETTRSRAISAGRRMRRRAAGDRSTLSIYHLAAHPATSAGFSTTARSGDRLLQGDRCLLAADPLHHRQDRNRGERPDGAGAARPVPSSRRRACHAISRTCTRQATRSPPPKGSGRNRAGLPPAGLKGTNRASIERMLEPAGGRLYRPRQALFGRRVFDEIDARPLIQIIPSLGLGVPDRRYAMPIYAEALSLRRGAFASPSRVRHAVGRANEIGGRWLATKGFSWPAMGRVKLGARGRRGRLHARSSLAGARSGRGTMPGFSIRRHSGARPHRPTQRSRGRRTLGLEVRSLSDLGGFSAGLRCEKKRSAESLTNIAMVARGRRGRWDCRTTTLSMRSMVAALWQGGSRPLRPTAPCSAGVTPRRSVSPRWAEPARSIRAAERHSPRPARRPACPIRSGFCRHYLRRGGEAGPDVLPWLQLYRFARNDHAIGFHREAQPRRGRRHVSTLRSRRRDRSTEHGRCARSRAASSRPSASPPA